MRRRLMLLAAIVASLAGVELGEWTVGATAAAVEATGLCRLSYRNFSRGIPDHNRSSRRSLRRGPL
jgi:hypothetical protein